MVVHWSLSDIKFPQISRTLLSILADLNNAVVWSPLILLFPSPPVPLLIILWLYQEHQLQLVYTSLSCSSFSSSLARSFFSFSFNFTLWSAETVRSTILQVSFVVVVVVDYYKVWSSGRGEFFLPVIRGEFSQKCKWKQVYSCHQDFSKYPNWS